MDNVLDWLDVGRKKAVVWCGSDFACQQIVWGGVINHLTLHMGWGGSLVPSPFAGRHV